MTPSSLEDMETRRVLAFLAVAFGFSWSIGALVILLTRSGSPPTVAGIPVTLPLVGIGFMFGPAVGHAVVRTITGEGWTVPDDEGTVDGDGIVDRIRRHLPRADTYLRPRILDGWPFWIAGWLLPAVLTVLGAGAYYLAFPGQFGGLEPTARMLAEIEGRAGEEIGVSPAAYLAIVVLASLTIAVPINAVGAFGEEFGWRGYLLPKLLPMGPRRAVVVLGVIWGVWHWPLTAIGHNYGLEYPYAPFPGMLAMLWFSTVVGVVFAWFTLRGGSVWPAVIAHATLNAVAGLGLLVASGDPTLLLGPTPAGVIASLPFAALAAWILADERRLRPPESLAGTGDDPDGAAPAATVGAPPGGASSAAAVGEEERPD